MLRYRLDVITSLAIAAAFFDALTTLGFIVTGTGVELNTTLSPLIQKSVAWIFIYLLCGPLIYPLLPRLSRNVLAIYSLTASLIFATSNLSGICLGDFFATRVLGYKGIVVIAITFATLSFVYLSATTFESTSEWIRHTCWLLLCVAVCGAVEGLFIVIASTV